MLRPPSQLNPLDEAISIYLKDILRKDLDYIAKFNAEEYKKHLEDITAFIKAILMTDTNYFAEYSADSLKIHLDVIVSFLKETLQSNPNYLAKFAAGELSANVSAIGAFIKEMDKLGPKFISQLASRKMDFLTAAIAVYLKEILTQNPNALARIAAGDSKFFQGRFFTDLKVDAKELKSQVLVKNALDLDAFFEASIRKVKATYSARLSKGSHLVDLFNIRVYLRKRLEANLTKLPVWGEIGFDTFGGAETLLDLFTNCICFRMITAVKDELQFNSLKELMSVLLEVKTLEDVIKQQENLDKRKSLMLENVAGKKIESEKDFEQVIADLKTTLSNAENFQQMKPDFIFQLNKELKIKLHSIYKLVNKRDKASAVIGLIELLVKFVEARYDFLQFPDSLLPSTHGLLTAAQQIYNEIALVPNKDFNHKIEILKTRISTVLEMKTESPRRVSNLQPPAPPVAKAKASLPPATPPVAKSAPIASPVPKLSLFSMEGQTNNYPQTVRNPKTAPASALPTKSSSARDSNARENKPK